MFLSRRKEESMQNNQTPATDYEQQYPEPKAHDNQVTLIESSGSAVIGVLKSIEELGIKVEG